MQQALDFLAETRALGDLIAPLEDADYLQETGFKAWTIDMVIRHLHFWNKAALFSLKDEAAFHTLVSDLMDALKAGSLTEKESEHFGGLSGTALRADWLQLAQETAGAFAEADPSQRLAWVGPSMSARSSITARLMETWAHGQEVYDQLGIIRQNEDRIRNIVVLGVNTYGWTFLNRKEDIPQPMPHLVLTAPSGEIWTYGDESAAERIEGAAEAFCQVVTQTRNIQDTALNVHGGNAKAWMEKAQCFAGPPQDPPAPGTRKTKEKS
ncbi:TIGR03084 family metal-binding protein [Hyphomonas pacifica]|uniref:Mycothiol-dependent maleylpyruvate isomerase metal-binding domain-containing protein n=1 Tax=Hyphomonas pacifica TaxID=1280941 RepID=A0A062TT97_9PROT|nr:TIGR03084 family metal-binding protein [Hyphomonas pacifica]KCZ46200.1 hypothetical protein HY2_05835 [Hyphomonas pacifica]RAN35802.1 hypothetical protein HY3_06810 [Hyphomonas pacifica]